jgi:hypothetical protein
MVMRVKSKAKTRSKAFNAEGAETQRKEEKDRERCTPGSE